MIANDLDMLEQIRNERTVELVADGYRLLDLRRWKTAVTELNKSIKGSILVMVPGIPSFQMLVRNIQWMVMGLEL